MVVKIIVEVVNGFGWWGLLGVIYFGVVIYGVVWIVVNVDKFWIGINVCDIIGVELGG